LGWGVVAVAATKQAFEWNLTILQTCLHLEEENILIGNRSNVVFSRLKAIHIAPAVRWGIVGTLPGDICQQLGLFFRS
jgi:hypothetical protein